MGSNPTKGSRLLECVKPLASQFTTAISFALVHVHTNGPYLTRTLLARRPLAVPLMLGFEPRF